MQSIGVPPRLGNKWEELRRKNGVVQLGLHLSTRYSGLGKALRVTTNSHTIRDSMLKKGNGDDFKKEIQKVCEVDVCAKNEATKPILNLQNSDDLHHDKF